MRKIMAKEKGVNEICRCLSYLPNHSRIRDRIYAISYFYHTFTFLNSEVATQNLGSRRQVLLLTQTYMWQIQLISSYLQSRSAHFIVAVPETFNDHIENVALTPSEKYATIINSNTVARKISETESNDVSRAHDHEFPYS